MRPVLLLLGALMFAPHPVRADPGIGRLFYTPAERAALEDARKRNIHAEELAGQASQQQPAAPRSRDVTLTGVVLRSDGESFAWVNGKSVEGRTDDGLRVRHTAQPNKVLVYDPDKGRMVQIKVGQRADLLTGRVEESYERRKREPAPDPGSTPQSTTSDTAPADRPARAPGKRAAQPDDSDDPARTQGTETQ